TAKLMGLTLGATLSASWPLLIIAGFLVGFGARLGNGCTSGHGICGMGRLSVRSIIATSTFMLTGFITVYLLKHVFGG
ncbi:MAG: YeeE/YedE family protein, partial [Plesiomonas shigelloides]